MNYADLTQLLQDTVETEETSFVTNIPNFVKTAEDDIYKNVQIPKLRKTSTAILTASNRYLALPSDFLSANSLAVTSSGTVYYLLNREADFIKEAYPVVDATGRPKYYGIFDVDTLILGPTPDSTYTVELSYYYHPESIVTASTTWIGDNAPNVLFYGSLVHAYTYLKGDGDVMQYYRDEYLRALANLQVLSEGRMRKDTYRRPNIRQEV